MEGRSLLDHSVVPDHRELHTYQLLVAERQVGDLPPAHMHHVKAAVRLPAEHPQRVCGATVEAAAVWVEADTPGPHTHTYRHTAQG